MNKIYHNQILVILVVSGNTRTCKTWRSSRQCIGIPTSLVPLPLRHASRCLRQETFASKTPARRFEKREKCRHYDTVVVFFSTTRAALMAWDATLKKRNRYSPQQGRSLLCARMCAIARVERLNQLFYLRRQVPRAPTHDDLRVQ